jgi:hypothetical protein
MDFPVSSPGVLIAIRDGAAVAALIVYASDCGKMIIAGPKACKCHGDW